MIYLCRTDFLTLKRSPPYPFDFSKNFFTWEKRCLFEHFNVIMKYIFPKTFIEIPQVVWNIWRFSSWILSEYWVFLLNIYTFCHLIDQKTNDVSILALTCFQYTVQKLYKVTIILNSALLIYEKGVKLYPSSLAQKATIKKPSFIRVNNVVQ